LSDFLKRKLQEYLFINIFDEHFKVEETDNPDERRTSTSKHWVGGSVIPLSSLLIAKQIEGQIHLKVPPMLMGYKSTQDSNPATLELYIQIDAIYSKPEKAKQQVNLFSQLLSFYFTCGLSFTLIFSIGSRNGKIFYIVSIQLRILTEQHTDFVKELINP
jgi:hypothetical protein